jgi:hypothetical protein
MRKILSVVLFVMLFTLFAGCGGNVPTASTTVLVYMEGTSLEEQDNNGTDNIKEMLAATSSSNLKIVLTTGAANKTSEKDNEVKSWKTVKRHVISNGRLTELEDIGNVDMGTTKVLTDFIEWGQRTRPADRYILVFWDHGGGPLGGFGGHRKPAGSAADFPVATNLSVSDLKKAVKDVVDKTGKPFELIGFDACLMATLEVADAFKDLGRYLVASEDIEPGKGWDWKVFLDYVALYPEAGGGDIGKAIANGYYAKMSKIGDQFKYITLSVIDLSKVSQVNSALASFSQWKKGLLDSDGLSAWSDLAAARSLSLDFYTSSLEANGASETVDLVDWVTQLDTLKADSRTNNLIDAVNRALVHQVYGSERKNVSGLTLMFPSVVVWDQTILNKYDSFDFVSDYKGLVRSFSDFARSDKVPVVSITKPTFENITGGKKMAASYSAKVGETTINQYRYERAYVARKRAETLGDGTAGMLYYGHQYLQDADPTKVTLEYAWTNTWYTLNGKPVSLIGERSANGGVLYKIPVAIALKTDTAFNDPTAGVYYISFDGQNPDKAVFLGFQATATNQAYSTSQLTDAYRMVPMGWFKKDSDPTGLGEWIMDTGNIITLPGGDPVPDDQSGAKWAVMTFAKTALLDPGQLSFVLYDLRWKAFASESVALP